MIRAQIPVNVQVKYDGDTEGWLMFFQVMRYYSKATGEDPPNDGKKGTEWDFVVRNRRFKL